MVIDIVRFVIIFVLQLGAIILMSILLLNYIKEKENKDIYFEFAFFFYIAAGLINIIYYFVTDPFLLSVLYSITISCTLMAPVAIFYLNLNFTQNIEKKTQLVSFLILTIIIFIINHILNTNNVRFIDGAPYWSFQYGLGIILFYMVLIILNIVYLYKIYKRISFKMQKRWTYFSAGIIILSFSIILAPLSNMAPPGSLQRSLGLLFFMAFLAIVMIYYSIMHDFEDNPEN